MHGDKLIVYSSPWKNTVLLVMSLLFVASGVVMLMTNGPVLVAWSSTLFFGLCAGVFAWQVVDRRPRIILDDVGIRDRMQRIGVIQWKDIDNAYVWSYQGTDCICLEIRDPEPYLGQLSQIKRTIASANRALGATPIVLNVSATDAGTARILEYILDRVAAIHCAIS